VHALGDVEDKVPAVTRGKPRHEVANVADAINAVAMRSDRAREPVDRVFLVELGGASSE